TQRFSAAVTGADDKSVTWSLVEGAGAGTISSDGTFVASQAPGTYHVVARAHADPAKAASATVFVSPNPVASISIVPVAADLTPGGSLQFRAVVSGVPDKDVIWSLREGPSGGAVDANGLYTAPVTAGLYHVIAASHADPSKQAVAAVSVALKPTITVSVDPLSVSLTPGATQHFTAQVTGTADATVHWSTTGGTIDAAGVYIAPAAEGLFRVTATSA